MTNKISHVIKRSGAIVPFNQERIANAIYRAVVAVGGRDKETDGREMGQRAKSLDKYA